jgi:tRNA G26 N,N-dimethylase Trm1
MSSIPRGYCRECGQVYFGWALEHGDTKCERCGGEVVVFGDLSTPDTANDNKGRV